MFEEADNFADFLRGGLPYYLLITLPILIICSSNPVLASSEFGVQRMSQYDVHGVPYGCRASALNLEAKSLYTWQTSRHCVVTRFQDMTIDQFREIRAKAGGLVILLPEAVSSLSFEEKQHIHLLEQAIMTQEISIPVYFSKYNPQLNEVIEDVTITASAHSKAKADSSKNRESAISEILGSISANGYQIVVSGATHTANKQSKIPIIQGELAPIKQQQHAKNSQDSESKLPLIILTAHLDTFGLVNEPLKNVDVAVLLTLVDLFSKLHATIPKYRLMFLVSESGALLNFQGMKKWLDVNLDENVQIQHAEFVICLDSIAKQLSNTNLFMHVSKPPKEGTPMNQFYKILKNVAQQYGNVSVEGVHKKINLADTALAWEHERFSMKRMPAFSLSNLKSHKDAVRTTIFEDDDEEEFLEKLQTDVKILAESLASYIYNIHDGEIFTGTMAINKDTIRPWLNIKSTQQNNDLKYAFEKYLKNVKLTYEKPDAREPDFMLYDDKDAVLNVYNVKPAVFDLFLTFLIASYLVTIYFIVFHFPKVYTFVCRLSHNKVKAN